MSVQTWGHMVDDLSASDPDRELVLSALKHAILGGEDAYDEAELSRVSGVEPELARRLWRAMGFVDPEAGGKVFTEADRRALSLVNTALASRPEDVVIQHTRVLSALLARVADVIATDIGENVEQLRLTGRSDAEVAEAAIDEMEHLDVSALLDYLFRRQLVTAVARQLTALSDDDSDTSTSAAVIFADLVGFTPLSQQLDDVELGRLVTRFQSVAFDLVGSSGGRVVKTLGDAVMVVCEDLPAAAEIACALAEVYGDDDLVPDVRVGMAYGPVLALQGDYFGPTVNLASRLSSLARPGTVLVSEGAHDPLAEAGIGRWTHLRPRRIKGIGWTSAWSLKRGPDAHRA